MTRIDIYNKENWEYKGHVSVNGELKFINMTKHYLFAAIGFDDKTIVLQWSLGRQKFGRDQKSIAIFDMCTDNSNFRFCSPYRHQYFN